MPLFRPVTASDGIHEIEVTDDATRMIAPSDEYRPTVRALRPDGEGRSPRRPGGGSPTTGAGVDHLARHRSSGDAADVGITVFLADDNVIVREGVRALLSMESDLEIVGVAGDYDELLSGATAAEPQVLVTDIRMQPSFQQEGIDAAKE